MSTRRQVTLQKQRKPVPMNLNGRGEVVTKRHNAVLSISILSTLLCLPFLAASQQPSATQTPTLRVSTRLVLVDVVVTDKRRVPIVDLRKEDFTILENGKPQTLATFRLEQPDSRARENAPPPKLPPGLYTNKAEYRTTSRPPAVLLMDALNTERSDQLRVRRAMIRFLKEQLHPGQEVAVLALTSRLLLLQDFTSDPQLLLAAMERYTGESSVQLSKERTLDPESDPFLNSYFDPTLTRDIVENIMRLERERVAESMDERVRLTMAALETITSILSGYDGRKSLIWVSGGLPYGLFQEYIDNNPFRIYATDFLRISEKLADHQIAIYPVDARGLVADDADAIRIRRTTAINPRTPSEKAFEYHVMMNELADLTGGRAFYNRNDTALAVVEALEDGTTYYTLGYYPQRNEWDGKFRRIKVEVDRNRVRIRHRKGYYATDPIRGRVSDQEAAEARLRRSLLTPLSATGVTILARAIPQNQGVLIDMVLDPATISFEELPDGKRRCELSILVAAYTPEGKLVTTTGRTTTATLSPPDFEMVRQHGLPFDIPLQLDDGKYALRLSVLDNHSGSVGTVRIPLSLEEGRSELD